MKPYYLYYFSTENGEHEFVVISDQPRATVIAEYGDEGDFVSSHEIVGDCTSLPCYRPLSK